MNTQKINNNIQYWHNSTELPKPNELILIESNNPKYKDTYFVGRFISEYPIANITYVKNTVIIIGLDTNTNLLVGYNDWDYNVKKWMYLTDTRKILQ